MKRLTILWASIFALAACNNGLPVAGLNGDDKQKDEATTEDAQDAPEDSTGGTGSVQVDFSTSTGLSLAGDETVTLGEATKVSMARFNIGMLKLKGKKDQTEKEKENEKSDVEEDKAAAADMGSEKAESDAKQGEDQEAADLKDGEHKVDGEEHRKDVADRRDEFKKKDEEQKEREEKRDGMTRVLDLIWDAILAKFEGDQPSVDVADGTYHRIEIKLRRNLTAEESDPLLGNVFVIKGTVDVKGAAVPFEISDHRAMNFRIRGEKLFAVNAAGDNPLAVVFDMDQWLTGIDLAALAPSADGTIYVNRHSNKNILKQMRRNIKASTHCGRDKDHDGKPDKDETIGAADPASADDED